MLIAGWRINVDALLARILYRWSGRTLLALLVACAALALLSGAVPPIWRGEAQLVVTAHPGARVEVDGKAWPHQLYAGRHIATATLPDGRSSTVEIELHRGETGKLELPPGLAPPRVRELPPAGPDSTVVRAGFADGAWRIQSARHDAQDGALETVALRAERLEPLSLLDAYGGRADVVTVGASSYQALYRPGGGSNGELEIHGWDDSPRTFAITGTLTFIRWAPDARALLVAERLRSDGEELRLFTPDSDPAPVLAVPGGVRDVVWHPDGAGAALLSRHQQRLTLTAIRLRPTLATRLLAERELPGAPGDDGESVVPDPLAVIPLAWSRAAIEWLAPDERGASMLWKAPLTTLLPERSGPLQAAALSRTPSGALRIARVWRGRAAIGRPAVGGFMVEAWLPDIPAHDELSGIWAPDGSSLLLHAASQAWLVDLPSAAGDE